MAMQRPLRGRRNLEFGLSVLDLQYALQKWERECPITSPLAQPKDAQTQAVVKALTHREPKDCASEG